MDVIHLTERNQEAVFEKAASILRRGGVVALPTDTVYGLAADVLKETAVKKVFRIKKRAHTKAMPVFVRDVAMAGEYAYVEARVNRLLGKFWPGQTTVVLQKKDAMPDLVTGGTQTVGRRTSPARSRHHRRSMCSRRSGIISRGRTSSWMAGRCHPRHRPR